jgi:hypothetical protein
MIHVMLPIQYLRRTGARTDPHRRLMAAVLQTVVDDCRGSVHRRLPGERRTDARGASQAAAYLTSTDRAWPFSFENLCEALSLDPVALRGELGKARAR